MYHAGELEAQELAGERSIGERNGRGMTNKIISGAINFVAEQDGFGNFIPRVGSCWKT